MFVLSPVPNIERQDLLASGHATNSRRELGQLPSGSVACLRRSGTHTPQCRCFNLPADGLTPLLGNEAPFAVEGIASRKTGSADAGRAVHVADTLIPGQRRTDQDRPGIGAQILGLIGPLRDVAKEPGSNRDFFTTSVRPLFPYPAFPNE